MMERSEILATMGELKLYGMKAAFDEIITTAVKRQHEPQRIVGDLLSAEGVALGSSQFGQVAAEQDSSVAEAGSGAAMTAAKPAARVNILKRFIGFPSGCLAGSLRTQGRFLVFKGKNAGSQNFNQIETFDPNFRNFEID